MSPVLQTVIFLECEGLGLLIVGGLFVYAARHPDHNGITRRLFALGQVLSSFSVRWNRFLGFTPDTAAHAPRFLAPLYRLILAMASPVFMLIGVGIIILFAAVAFFLAPTSPVVLGFFQRLLHSLHTFH